MLTRNNWLKITLMFIVGAVLLVGMVPAVTYAANEWQPAPAKAGMASIVWTNYVGGGNELTVDVGGTLYKIPPEANNIPGRLQIDVTPGTISYTASVPFGSVSRTVDVASGQVIGLGFYGKLDVPTEGAADNGDHNPGSHGAAHNEDHHNPDAHQPRYTDLLVSQVVLTATASQTTASQTTMASQ
jgi:hypothetical protein